MQIGGDGDGGNGDDNPPDPGKIERFLNKMRNVSGNASLSLQEFQEAAKNAKNSKTFGLLSWQYQNYVRELEKARIDFLKLHQARPSIPLFFPPPPPPPTPLANDHEQVAHHDPASAPPPPLYGCTNPATSSSPALPSAKASKEAEATDAAVIEAIRMRDAEKVAADDAYAKSLKEIILRQSEEESKLNQRKRELQRVEVYVKDRQAQYNKEEEYQQERIKKLKIEVEREEAKKIKEMHDRIEEKAAREQAEAKKVENDKWVLEEANAQRAAAEEKAKRAAAEYARKKNDQEFFGPNGQLAASKRSGEDKYTAEAEAKKRKTEWDEEAKKLAATKAECAAVSQAASALPNVGDRSGHHPQKASPPTMPPVSIAPKWPSPPAYPPPPYAPYVPATFQPVPPDAPVQDNGNWDDSGWQTPPFQGSQHHFHNSTWEGNSARSTPPPHTKHRRRYQTPPPPPLPTSGWPVEKGLPMDLDPRMHIADWTDTDRCT